MTAWAKTSGKSLNCPSEKSLERYLCNQVKAHAGRCFKFVSPGMTGVPDRICLFPAGKLGFAEIKAAGKQPTKKQDYVINLIRQLGFDVAVLDSRTAIDAFVRQYIS